MNLYFVFLLQLYCCLSFPIKPKLTLDEFLNSTMFIQLSLSPTGQYLLFQTVQPSWNTSSYEQNLWIYDVQQETRKLITTTPHKSMKPQWSPNGNWIALLLDDMSQENSTEQQIFLYSLVTNDLLPIQKIKDTPLALTWSDNDFSLYLATTNGTMLENDPDDQQWRDTLRYRHNKQFEHSTIYRIDINEHNYRLTVKKHPIKNVSFLIGELLYVAFDERLVFTSMTPLMETLQDFELYSIDLLNTSLPIVRLTDNEIFEKNLRLSTDGTRVLFLSDSLGSTRKKFNDTQARVYSLDLITGQITHLTEKFKGNVNGFTIKSNGDIFITGQIGTETQIYSQRMYSDDIIEYFGWNGTYELISMSNLDSIAFVHSSTEKPMEIYLIDDINQLCSARAITQDNQWYTQRDLPQAKSYRWKNEDDQRVIEGILHYPPGQFDGRNLPLLVLIHGGPYSASVNRFSPDWYSWAPLAASEGWLVFEPNYRGSTGYGDEFLQQIRYRPLSLPGKDILYGVDQLIRDGTVDPYRLTIGGYSYGGFLTNWLITQTKRFNAALSGAGAAEHISAWGLMDLPVLITYLFGGYPWEVPHIYQHESPLYQLDRVRTPTLIITGERDIRVPTSQSYILERALYARDIPVQLIGFPHEGHDLTLDPWHGKIKLREELNWLKQYENNI